MQKKREGTTHRKVHCLRRKLQVHEVREAFQAEKNIGTRRGLEWQGKEFITKIGVANKLECMTELENAGKCTGYTRVHSALCG